MTTFSKNESGKSRNEVLQRMQYLEQLLSDQKALEKVGNLGLTRVPELLEKEIDQTRQLFHHLQFQESSRSSQGHVQLMEKVYISTSRFPEYNFAGRILGPRGMTVKRLEQETGCRVQVRGKGSMKCDKDGEGNDEDLHVVITADGPLRAAAAKLEKAKEVLNDLLNPNDPGMDALKRRQLIELAIINGNYRPAKRTVLSALNDKQRPQNYPVQQPKPQEFGQSGHFMMRLPQNPNAPTGQALPPPPTICAIPCPAAATHGV